MLLSLNSGPLLEIYSDAEQIEHGGLSVFDLEMAEGVNRYDLAEAVRRADFVYSRMDDPAFLDGSEEQIAKQIASQDLADHFHQAETARDSLYSRGYPLLANWLSFDLEDIEDRYFPNGVPTEANQIENSAWSTKELGMADYLSTGSLPYLTFVHGEEEGMQSAEDAEKELKKDSEKWPSKFSVNPKSHSARVTKKSRWALLK